MATQQTTKTGPDACIRCGYCNAGGDAYTLSLDERRSPRHLVVSCKAGVRGPVLYAAPLNGRAQALCPLHIGIDEAILAARRVMVRDKQETTANHEMIAKLREGKNPYR